MLKRPFFIIGAASFFTALLCAFLPAAVLAVAAGLTAAALIVIWLVRVPRAVQKAVTLAAVSALVIGGLYLLKNQTVVLPALSYSGQTVQATVQIKEPASSDRSYIVEAKEGDLPTGTRLCLWVGENEAALKSGDLLRGSFVLTAAFDASSLQDAAYARANGTYLYAWSAGAPLVYEDGHEALLPWEQAVIAVRERIHRELYDRLPLSQAALCESVLLGVKDNLPDTLSEAFRGAGVYHLLVVSGLHLSMISGAVLWALRRLRLSERLCAAIAMPVVFFFMMLCGFSPAVLRAGIMTLLMLFSILLRRRADGLNSLGAAAALMLLANPFAACDIGMQLSFAATAGLLLLCPIWDREVTARVLPQNKKAAAVLRFAVSLVGVSVCATLATMPLSALYFSELSSLFLAGNLLCVLPACALIVLCALSLVTALIPFLDLLCNGLFWLVKVLCDRMIAVTGWLSSLPFSTVFAGEPYLILWLFGLAVLPPLGYVLYRRRGAVCVLSALALILLLGTGITNVMRDGVAFITAADSKTAAFVVQESDGCGMVFGGDGKALKSACRTLKNRGINELSWLVWLNEPAVQTIDLSALAVPIDRLILCERAESYTALPTAEQVMCLTDEKVYALSKNSSLERRKDFWRLSVGETSLLLCPKNSDAALLPAAWRSCDVLLYQTLLPVHTDLLQADMAICFCAERDAPDDAAAPCGAHVLLTPSTDGARSFMTRGHGDITLR
ncbi:MAG: ComEC/Rec2 family competence protein [Acutalibacteraceae bacterium]